jgi:hypothetical protein
MARLTPLFSATRTIREYTEQLYIPCAAAFLERAADKGVGKRRISSPGIPDLQFRLKVRGFSGNDR